MEKELDLVETDIAETSCKSEIGETTDVATDPTIVDVNVGIVTKPKHKSSVSGVIIGTALIGGVCYTIYKYGKKATSYIVSKLKKNKKAKEVIESNEN